MATEVNVKIQNFESFSRHSPVLIFAFSSFEVREVFKATLFASFELRGRFLRGLGILSSRAKIDMSTTSTPKAPQPLNSLTDSPGPGAILSARFLDLVETMSPAGREQPSSQLLSNFRRWGYRVSMLLDFGCVL